MVEASRRTALPRRRPWLAGLAVLSITGLLCLVVLELVLRVAFPPETVFIEEHAVFGFANIPGKTGYWKRETDEPVRVEINSKRLRDVERPYEKPRGHVRVLMLGDSYLGAFNTPFEKIAARELQSLLRSSLETDRVQVINAGTQGWGTAQELLYLEHEGLRYEPDVVILNFFLANDFGNNYAGTAAPTKPRYSLEDGELRFHAPIDNASVSWVRDEILARSALARAVRRSGLLGMLDLNRTMARIGLISSGGNRQRDDRTTQEMITIACRLVGQMEALVREHEASFHVHLIPTPWTLAGHYPPDGPNVQPNPHAAASQKQMRDGLLECLRAEAVPYTFAWERMVRDTEEGRILFTDGRGHWTPFGNRRAAEDLHRAILPTVRQRLAGTRTAGSGRSVTP